MPGYEYKVVPAPTRGLKARGVKTPEGRFANSLQAVLNTHGAEGWEYCRAELLPSDERTGLTGSTTNWRNVLVFRREIAEEEEEAAAVLSVVPLEVAMSAEAEVGQRSDEDAPEPDGKTKTPASEGRAAEKLKVAGLVSAMRSPRERSADQSEDGASAADEGATRG